VRALRILLALLGLTLLTPVSPAVVPAHAAPAPNANVFAYVDNDDTGVARVIVFCLGDAPPADTARVVVDCDLFDSSTRPSIHHSRSYTGAAGVCVINAFNMQMPVEYCATVTATYRDLSQKTDTACAFSGGAPPAHNAPPPFAPKLLECLDPVGTGV
jgi:hypothetical protein